MTYQDKMDQLTNKVLNTVLLNWTKEDIAKVKSVVESIFEQGIETGEDRIKTVYEMYEKGEL